MALGWLLEGNPKAHSACQHSETCSVQDGWADRGQEPLHGQHGLAGRARLGLDRVAQQPGFHPRAGPSCARLPWPASTAGSLALASEQCHGPAAARAGR